MKCNPIEVFQEQSDNNRVVMCCSVHSWLPPHTKPRIAFHIAGHICIFPFENGLWVGQLSTPSAYK